MSRVLADTSVWIDHLRAGEPELARLLAQTQVVGHPFVQGEIALGSISDRATVLALMANLPQATVAAPGEVLTLIENSNLFGQGLGYVDVHLLAAARLTPGAHLWTRDRRLREAAAALGVGHG
jgi:hypothetical protein